MTSFNSPKKKNWLKRIGCDAFRGLSRRENWQLITRDRVGNYLILLGPFRSSWGSCFSHQIWSEEHFTAKRNRFSRRPSSMFLPENTSDRSVNNKKCKIDKTREKNHFQLLDIMTKFSSEFIFFTFYFICYTHFAILLLRCFHFVLHLSCSFQRVHSTCATNKPFTTKCIFETTCPSHLSASLSVDLVIRKKLLRWKRPFWKSRIINHK